MDHTIRFAFVEDLCSCYRVRFRTRWEILLSYVFHPHRQLPWRITPAKIVRFRHDVIKWKHFPRYCPFVRGIHWSPVNSPHEGQWRGALMFSLICAWTHGWVNNRKAGDLRFYRALYDVTVMISNVLPSLLLSSCRSYFNFKMMLFHYDKYNSIWNISVDRKAVKFSLNFCTQEWCH